MKIARNLILDTFGMVETRKTRGWMFLGNEFITGDYGMIEILLVV